MIHSENSQPHRCTDCQVGQGDYCHCSEPIPIDPVAVRWLWVALTVFWIGIVELVTRCS